MSSHVSSAATLDSNHSINSDEQIEGEYESPYQHHFQLVLSSIFEHHQKAELQSYFSSDELHWHSCYSSVLSIHAQGLYARLFQRKGPWFSSNSMLKYPEIGPSHDLDHCLEELHQNQLISLLRPQSSLDNALDVLQIMTLPELQLVMKKLSQNPKKTWKNKTDLVQQLVHISKTQKCITGAALPLAKIICQTMHQQILIKLTQAPWEMFRRCHQLVYCSSYRQEALTTWPRLLAMLLKQPYPYIPRSVTHNHTKMYNPPPMFRSLADFLCLQVAQELQQYAWNSEGLGEVVLNEASCVSLLVFQSMDILSVHDKERVYANVRTFLDSQPSPSIFMTEILHCFKVYHHHFGTSYCGAGQILGMMLWNMVKALEMDRNYSTAILILESLIASSCFCQYKRGRFWTRLVIDYEHIHAPEKATTSCQKALETDQVSLSRIEVLSLRHRLDRLTNKVLRDVAQPLSNTLLALENPTDNQLSMINDIDPDEDDFVSSVEPQKRKKMPVKKSSSTPHASKKRKSKSIAPQDASSSSALMKMKHEIPQFRLQGRPLNSKVGEKSRFIGYDDESCSVESLVLQYLAQKHWIGQHSEGRILRALFGLLFWPVIYADLPEVVPWPGFQIRPLDFPYARAFFDARQDLFESQKNMIQGLSTQELMRYIQQCWTQHLGKLSCLGIGWEKLSLVFLQFVAAGIGAQALGLVCFEFAQQAHALRAGQPDLVLIHMTLKEDCEGKFDFESMFDPSLNEKMDGVACFESTIDHVCVKFVEVKGPRDELAERQIVWLDLLLSVGIDAQVCRVIESSVPENMLG